MTKDRKLKQPPKRSDNPHKHAACWQRHDRLSQALRDNLAKRKRQARARTEADSDRGNNGG
ncbi:MAG: hypothetical protein AAEC10_08820 [Rhodospirillales bacterium]